MPDKSGEHASAPLSQFDPTTGLLNRLGLMHRLESLIKAHADGQHQHFFILRAGFVATPQIAPEELTRRFADLLGRFLELPAFAARVGIADFAIVLENTRALAEATSLAQTLVDGFTCMPDTHDATLSIGICFCGSTNIGTKNLLHHAHVAMEAARQAGGNLWRIYKDD